MFSDFPNLLELLAVVTTGHNPVPILPTGDFARSLLEFGLPISLFGPSNGWFSPEFLLETQLVWTQWSFFSSSLSAPSMKSAVGFAPDSTP